MKANKLLDGSETFIKTISNSVVDGLSMSKTARVDLRNLIKNSSNKTFKVKPELMTNKK